jgi:hypothetical protein
LLFLERAVQFVYLLMRKKVNIVDNMLLPKQLGGVAKQRKVIGGYQVKPCVEGIRIGIKEKG